MKLEVQLLRTEFDSFRTIGNIVLTKCIVLF